jgi:hypothetical protein
MLEKRPCSEKDLELMRKSIVFVVRGTQKRCQATGYQARFDGIWYNEYIDDE